MAERLLVRADRLSAEGNAPEARQLYEECLRLATRRAVRASAAGNLALLEMECGKHERAIELYEQALREEPCWFEGLYNLGNLYMEMGPEGETRAIRSFERAIEIRSDDAAAHNNLAICFMQAGRLQDAVEQAKCALRLDKNNVNIQANLAELYNELGDVTRALFFSKKASKANFPNALLLQASILRNMQDAEASLACLKSLFESGTVSLPGNLRYYSMLLAAGQVEQAKDVVESTIAWYSKSHPRDKVGHFALSALVAPLGKGKSIGAKTAELLCQKQETLSHACEMLLLHLALPKPSDLANKCLISENLERISAEDVMPETWVVTNPEDLQPFQHTESGLYFLKNPSLQRGQGITVLRLPEDLEKARGLLPKNTRMCLQKAVKPLLLDGRKFGIRMHVFLLFHQKRLSVFMCGDGILTKCANLYSEADTSLQTQVTCTSVQRGMHGFDREKAKGLASRMWQGFVEKLPAFRHCVAQTVEAVKDRLLSDVFLRAGGSLVCGQLFGYDFLVSEEGNPVFVEANVCPQFQDAKNMGSLRSSVAKPLINGSLCLFSGAADPSIGGSLGGWHHISDIHY